MLAFLNFLFPEKNICFICEDYGSDIKENLCSICKERFVFIGEQSCSICGRKLKESKNSPTNIRRCKECMRHPHYFTKSVSPLSYEGDIKRAIYDYKYNNKQHMYKLFSKLMVKSILENDLEQVDLVIPIPLYIDREKRRGFNQAHLLAKSISKKLNIKLDNKSLIRSRHTKAQNKLDRNERIKNIKGVFALREKENIKQKKILLIDDILTTGSTVDECSKLLLENGADLVFVSTIAITPNRELIYNQGDD